MRQLLTSAAALALLAGVAAGQTNRDLLAINNLQGDSNNNNGLIAFNPTTLPNWTTIGLTGLSGCGAMDFTGASPMNGAPMTLYAVDTFGTGGFYSIDHTTGVATYIGSAGAAVDDFAYNPADGYMYGITGSNLYRFDLGTGGATLVGTYNIGGLETGLGFDSAGNAYIQDLVNDKIYKAAPGSFNAVELYNLLNYGISANYSQGLFVDWSNGNRGYYGALNVNTFDGELWEFDINGGGMFFISNFGPLDPDGLPPVETGDLTAYPIPAPASIALLGLGGLALRRRR